MKTTFRKIIAVFMAVLFIVPLVAGISITSDAAGTIDSTVGKWTLYRYCYYSDTSDSSSSRNYIGCKYEDSAVKVYADTKIDNYGGAHAALLGDAEGKFFAGGAQVKFKNNMNNNGTYTVDASGNGRFSIGFATGTLQQCVNAVSKNCMSSNAFGQAACTGLMVTFYATTVAADLTDYEVHYNGTSVGTGSFTLDTSGSTEYTLYLRRTGGSSDLNGTGEYDVVLNSTTLASGVEIANDQPMWCCAASFPVISYSGTVFDAFFGGYPDFSITGISKCAVDYSATNMRDFTTSSTADHAWDSGVTSGSNTTYTCTDARCAVTKTTSTSTSGITVTFDNSGGRVTSTPAPQTVSNGGNATAPNVTANSAYGSTVIGWTADSETRAKSGMATLYDFNNAVTSNITLRPVVAWKVNLRNGPEGQTASKTLYKYKEVDLSLPTSSARCDSSVYSGSTLASYGFKPKTANNGSQRSFMEWNTDYSTVSHHGSGAQYWDTYTEDGDVTLYAMFGYPIIYDAEEGGHFEAGGQKVTTGTLGDRYFETYVANYRYDSEGSTASKYAKYGYVMPDGLSDTDQYGVVTPVKGDNELMLSHHLTSEGEKPTYFLFYSGGTDNETQDHYMTVYADQWNSYSVLQMNNSHGQRSALFPAAWNVAVKYDANGGTGGRIDHMEVQYSTGHVYDSYTVKSFGNSGITAPAGSTFRSWNTEPDGTGTTYAVGTNIGGTRGNSDPVTLYAIWNTTVATYPVNYNANGGTGSIASGTKIQNVAYTLSNGSGFVGPNVTVNFNANGGIASQANMSTTRMITGWRNSANSGASYPLGGSYTTNSAVTMYAQWSAAIVDFSSVTASRANYTFDGWYTAANGGQAITSKSFAAANSADSIEVFAHWTPITYAVTYNANGGANAPASGTKYSGETYTIASAPSTAPTYTVTFNYNGGTGSPASQAFDRSFTEWNTQSDGQGTGYSAGSGYTADAALDLYAVWGGAVLSGLPTPTREDYTFIGWKDALGNTYSNGDAIADDVTLIAQWTETLDDTLKFSGANLTLYNTFAINFRVAKSAADQYADVYATFGFNGVENAVRIDLDDAAEDGNYYVFVYNDIAPNLMGEQVVAQLHGTKDGKLKNGTIKYYSIADYCYNMLANAYCTTHTNFRTLLVDILNYGSSAENYTNVHSTHYYGGNNTRDFRGGAVNEIAEFAAYAVYGTSTAPVKNDIYGTKVPSGAAEVKADIVGRQPILADTVAIRFYVTATDVDLSECSIRFVTYNVDDKIQTIVQPLGALGNYYVAVFNNFNATQMDKKISATVVDANGTPISSTLEYSVATYYSAHKDDGDLLADLVTSMMKYGDSANRFVKSPNV